MSARVQGAFQVSQSTDSVETSDAISLDQFRCAVDHSGICALWSSLKIDFDAI